MFTVKFLFSFNLQFIYDELIMTKQEFQKKLGTQIAKLRKDKNLSQIEFADLLDREKQNINRLENGGTNPSSWLIYEIAEALGVHPNQIFDFIPKKK